MIVGAALVELHVHGSTSLKQKRGVVRSITQRVRNKFNISVAEVDGQDTWQRAVIGLTTVGSEPRKVRQVLERAVTHIETLHLAELRETDIEIMDLPHESGAGLDGDDLPWHDEE
jgi:uncharacterized protein YlxP (DUF503 family)